MKLFKSILACVCVLCFACLCSCESVLLNQTENSSFFAQSEDGITSSQIENDEQTESQTVSESLQKPQGQSGGTSSKTQENSGVTQNPSAASSKPETSSGPSLSSQPTAQTKPESQPQTNSPVKAVSADKYFGWTQLEKKGSEAEKKAYKLLVSEIGNYKSTVTFNFNLTKSEFEDAYALYKEDYPEHFWRSGEYKITTVGSKVTRVVFENTLYDGDVNKIKAAKSKIDAAVEEILSQVKSTMSDYEKEVVIHDHIINRTKYVNGENSHSILGVFVDGEAVCQGYSLAFQYVMRLAGVQCITVTGRFSGQSHMWNMVELDGEYYHVDVTADDPIVDNWEDVIDFNYFNLNDKQIKLDHTIKNPEFTVPAANSNKYEFFKKTGQLYKEFSVNNFANSIVYSYQHGYKYAYMCFENTDLSKAADYIKDNYYAIIGRANELLGANKIKRDTKIDVMYAMERGILNLRINY